MRPRSIKCPPPPFDPGSVSRTASAIAASTNKMSPKLLIMTFMQKRRMCLATAELFKMHIVSGDFQTSLAADISSTLSSGNTHLINATLNLIRSITSIAAGFDPEFEDPESVEAHVLSSYSFVTDALAPALSTSIGALATALADVKEETIDVYEHAEGELYEVPDKTAIGGGSSQVVKAKKNVKKSVKTRKGQGNFGADFEDEEWEREMKKELEAKKGPTKAAEVRVYSKEELKQISAQSATREEVRRLFSSYTSVLAAVSSIGNSDFSIGNATLPTFASVVSISIALSESFLPPSIVNATFDTLTSLCRTVYEIDESVAVSLASCLIVTKVGEKPLPVPCSSASTVISSISEFGDAMSGNSFNFVYPVLRAALIGAQRASMAADDALVVLLHHAEAMSDGDAIHSLRRSMAETVLTLLSHDRCKTFTRPTPADVLVSLYNAPRLQTKVTASELAPLLNNLGTLGKKAARVASLKALQAICQNQPLKFNPLVESRIFMNCFSEEGAVHEAATDAFTALHDGTREAPCSKLLAIPLITLLNKDDTSSAKAVAQICAQHPSTITTVLKKLFDVYVKAYPTTFPQATAKKPSKSSREALEDQFFTKNAYDHEADTKKNADSADKIEDRAGVVSAICEIGDLKDIDLSSDNLKVLVSFVLSYALTDPVDDIRTKGVDAGRKLVSTFGALSIDFLLELFEGVLTTGSFVEESDAVAYDMSKVVKDVWASDFRKEGAVVLLGSSALHITDNDDKIKTIVEMLVDALDTPSECVQSSVAKVLSPLMKKGDTKDRAEDIINRLMKKVLKDESLAVRRGAAYGVSAVVKGVGIASLKKYDIIKRLTDALTCTYAVSKEGALFVVELLCERLGLLFEPYIIILLPALLKCFGDSSDYVRSAAGSATGLIMSKLSAHGVKLVMPAVLKAFSEDNWRAKQASIRMLGAMTNCAPRQLASCLPKIVPKLTEAFSDTHPKVKASAENALNQIITVIRNPEVSGLSKVLLKALVDPANSTKKGLEALLSTEFLHAIDAPSLAILIPVLQRGLKDKSGTAKRQSVLIVGNLVTMCNDPKDFVPYVPTLLPGLKATLLDPIPDVRTTASKSVGSLVRGLGTSQLGDLETWLHEALKSEDGSAVERSGAAQGLSELIVAQGKDVALSVTREEIIPLSKHPSASIREGVLWVLTFMPNVLGQGYAELIDAALPPLLKGLSDESEPVREVAMRAGRVLIRSLGKSHTSKILPSLEDGLLNDDYRIRMASLNLVGDLLSMLGGVQLSGIGSEDDAKGAEKAQAQIALVLGSEVRNRVLARLYMARSDTSAVVRQGAVQVWKTVVSVTPRTLREILPALISHIVDALASENVEMTTVAGRCLGDIVKKLGDSVLPEVIPILQKALYQGDCTTRKGVCVGLHEIIEEGSKEQIAKFMSTLAPAVKDGLCDNDDGVRRLAAGCFQQLCSTIGPAPVTEVIVPSLLIKLEKINNNNTEGDDDDDDDDDDEGRRALLGLKEVLRVRSRELLPYLVPKLVGNITVKNAVILSNVIEATGETIHMHLVTIIPAVTLALTECPDDDVARLEGLTGVVRSLSSNISKDGVNWLVSEFAKRCGHDKAVFRKSALFMIKIFAEERKVYGDFTDELPILLREVLSRLVDDDDAVLEANSAALKAVMASVSPDELVKHVDFSRSLINSLVSEARRRKGGVGDGLFLMPGFCRKKGLDALIPMFHHAVIFPSTREIAATGIGEMVSMTDTKFLAATVVVKFVGPLIRVVGDRNTSSTKCAIIKALHTILNKAGASLRAFVPQLQTTLLKALSDTHRSVRVAATESLADLMSLASRVDPLIAELTSQSLNSEAIPVRTAHLQALSGVLRNGGKKSKKPETIEAAFEATKELVKFRGDEGVRLAAGTALGACVAILGDERGVALLEEPSENGDGASRAVMIRCVCENIDLGELGDELLDRLCKEVISYAGDAGGKGESRCAASEAFGILICKENFKNFASTALKNLVVGDGMDDINTSMLLGLKNAGLRIPNLYEGPGEAVKVVTAALNLSKLGNSRTQYVANKFLFVAFRMMEDDADGVASFAKICGGETARLARELSQKVIAKMKNVYSESD